MVTLTINGKRVKAKEDATLLEICRKLSIPIPTLCYHPDLSPHGSCRLCTVEILRNGRSRLVTACNYPVREGIDVQTHSDPVLRARRVLVELLVARCPRVPLVQDLARELGIEEKPFKTENPDNDCILCGLCVRTCNEIVGANAIGFSKRGTQKRIGTPFDVDSEKCIACGACEYICPTGAVKMEMDRVRKMKRSDTGTRRSCRYMRLGLVDFMLCSNGYECWRCETDQRMEDRFGTHPAFALKPAQAKQPCQVSGFTFHPECFYSPQHVWAKPVEERFRLGLDDLAALFAIDPDSIQLPPDGSPVEKNQILADIRVAGKEAKILSPLSGTVTAVNHDVEESPSLIWKDPYRRGWLVLLQPRDLQESHFLYSGEAAKAWFSKEAIHLTRRLAEWAPNPSPKGPTLYSHWIQRIVRDRWNEMKDVLSVG